MSKRCLECEQVKRDFSENCAEFEVWYEGHKDLCNINHYGSSASMEQAAGLTLWKRSESKGFRYTTLLSDGDAKTFIHLNSSKVYGDTEIKKEECINHVSKRLGTALRNAVKEWRTKGVTLGGKSHGSLKEVTIQKLTRYYQGAIRRNKGNVDAMKTAVYATLFHSISTDKKPKHSKCPPGKESWCFYQAALARGEKPGSHKINVKTPINEAHLEKILPIYQRLASNELLERCVRCSTQNANESLHSIIWNKCSKQTSASLRRVNIAVCDAILEFNTGKFNSLHMVQAENNLPVTKQSKDLAKSIERRRLYVRKRQQNATLALVRQKIKLAQKRRDAASVKKEGITYKAGGF